MSKVKSFFGEFKEFISRGNVIDLAVGVIIGSAFTSIVNSLVNDLVMPLIGWLFGGIDFTTLQYVTAYAEDGGVLSAIRYGNFIQCIVNFLLIAFVVFLFVRFVNSLRRKKEEEVVAEPAPEPAPSEEVLLLREIRDSLKK